MTQLKQLVFTTAKAYSNSWTKASSRFCKVQR